MNLVLFGAPGSGKGTQAERLRDRFSLKHISTGDLLRDAVARGTELGKKVKDIMSAGELVSDEIVLELIKEAVDDAKAGWILDGYPRTMAQAKALDELLAKIGHAIDGVVVLEVNRDAIITRLSSRRSCPECKSVYNVLNSPPAEEGKCDKCGADLVHREDDQPATIANRLDVYSGQTAPILEYYEGKVTIHRVDGNLPVDEVAETIEQKVR